ncbi:uncharacterized protein LOC116163975 [Photinus pyralis]|uniref:uncharacterized protein LOC116163975 n=1 Tax=Photinus pyralis TaxID=7054 RepID=UPI0012670F81|nr:uncharacterized protein LOC116163975 [Photinus pyralis]
MTRMEPGADWVIFDNVKIFGNYHSYKEALYQESKTANYSSESKVDLGPRKRKPNSKYIDNSLSSPPPLPTDLDSENEATGSQLHTAHDSEYSDGPSEASTVQSTAHEEEATVIEYTAVEDIPILYDVTPPTTTGTDKQKISDFEHALLTEMREIKATLDVMSIRLRHIERRLEVNVQLDRIEPNLFTDLPCKSLQEVTDLEAKLEDDKIFQKLITILKYVGGSNAKYCVTNCLKKIFSNIVGQFCSWTGQKGNFKVADLKLIMAIREAVRATFALTDADYQSYVQVWFQHAKTRHLRETK